MADMGAPTKYEGAETIEKTRRYLKEYESLGDAIPSLAGLAVILGVSRETVRAWQKETDKTDFSAICSELLSEQERVLVNKGLQSEFNSAITKLVLGKHGYHEKQDTTLSGGDNPIKTESKIVFTPARMDGDDK